VLVTGAAASETWRIDPPGGVVTAGQVITFARGAATVQYTAGVGETLADTVAGLNTTWAQAGLAVTAQVDGAGMLLTADAAGTAQAFSVALGATLGTKVTAGRDVTGFIDAEEAVGKGSVLALQQGSGGAVGLSIDVPVTVAEITATGGSVGSVTYAPGLAQRLLTVVDDATRSADGLLATAQEGRLRAVKDYQRQIERWDDRLTSYRTMITRQFTAMETAIASLKSATSFLSGLTTTTTS
jgi:flagellar hook-associated protein 2